MSTSSQTVEAWEGNGPCQDCERPSPCWRAPDDLWALVTGSSDGGGGFICPSCFSRRVWVATGKIECWKLVVWDAYDALVAENKGLWEVVEATRWITTHPRWTEFGPNRYRVSPAQAHTLTDRLAAFDGMFPQKDGET